MSSTARENQNQNERFKFKTLEREIERDRRREKLTWELEFERFDAEEVTGTHDGVIEAEKEVE